MNNPKKRTEETPPNFIGKLPPQAVELEQAVLGAILLEKEALIMVDGILSEKIFYKDAHVLIYRAIKSLSSEGNPVDMLTVTQELRKQGNLENAGGAYYITEITSNVASSANTEFHARVIQEMYMKRRAIAIASELIVMGYDEQSDAFDIMEKMQEATLETLHDIDNGHTVSYKEAYTEAIKELSTKIGKSKKDLTGVDTGFMAINALTGGWQKPDLIIIAGRPAMGKTALALCLLRNAAKAGFPVAIFSLEMSKSQLANRLLAIESEIASSSDIQRGNLSEQDFTALFNKTGKSANYPMYIDDTAGLSIHQLRSKAYKLKAKYDLKMIIVDYLQLMSGDGRGNRENEISQISRGLKKIAKELDIPVIALSQLSRSVEQRGGEKRPQLSDLRESGAIEQDADIVIFTHRPEYYGITEDSAGNSTKGVAEIIFAKHRNGDIDTVQTQFVGRFTKFKDISEFQDLPEPVSDDRYGQAFRSITTPDF